VGTISIAGDASGFTAVALLSLVAWAVWIVVIAILDYRKTPAA